MMLESDDHERIQQAVARAKAATRGRIVCVVTDEAAAYAEVPLAWAATGSLLLPFLALSITSIAGHFDFALGSWAVAHVVAMHTMVLTALTSYAMLQGVLFFGIFALVSVPPIRRRLTPPPLKRARVRQRAIEQFSMRGLDRIREQTGVLIFVSLNDRRIEVLADSGISAKVESSTWDDVIGVVVAGFKAGAPGDGFVTAIERCGRLLAEHYPGGSESPQRDDRTL